MREFCIGGIIGDWGNQNFQEKNLSQCHLAHHKSGMDYPETEPRIYFT
jgi:hypothetical protein